MGVKANIRSQTIELVGKIRTFQNGRPCHDQECHENGGPPVRDGFERCVSVHPSTSIPQEIPKVQVERENPSVEVSFLRPYIRPKIIYKNLETYGGHTPSSGSKTSDLCRRHVNFQ